MKGIITTIQRMSIHDGPGIRSTLFLKGCDLRCAWCHNPETWSKHRQLQYIASKCIRCGTCIAACDQKALRGRGTACHRPCRLQPLRQMHRGVPDGCHVLDRTRSERRRGSPRIIGGQNLLPDFGRRRHAVGRGAVAANRFCTRSTRRLPRAGNPYGRRVEPYGKLGCRRNVSPAGETLDVRPETADPELHRRWTGQGNGRIISNLRQLADKGVPIIVRTRSSPALTTRRKPSTHCAASYPVWAGTSLTNCWASTPSDSASSMTSE